MRLFLIFLVATLTLVSCATTAPPPESARDAAAQLQAVIDTEWEQRLGHYPQLAARYGARVTRPLTDMSLDAIAQRNAESEQLLAELDAIDQTRLTPDEQVNFAVMHRILSDRVENHAFHGYLIPMTVDEGFHTALARLPNAQRLDTPEAYDRYLEQLDAIPTYMQQHIDLLSIGLDKGMTLPKVILDGYEGTIAAHVVERPEDSVFFAPFQAFPTHFDAATTARLEREGSQAVMESAVPAYGALLDFMTDTYIPNARETIGASEMPDGKRYYEALVRQFTTLDLTPPQVHEIGLKEVARIRDEMQQVINTLEYEGTFAEFIHYLRTDPAFYAETPDELLDYAMVISKRMDGALPALFGKLPRMPYTVAPVPDHIAPKYTGGRYVPTSIGSKRPGYYWVNTFALESRPLYIMEALSLHEAVPGHHLQISLSQELDHLPPFRRELYLSAFGEGWGLYSEWLGKEAGFYQDPYSEFGRLTYEMWRACRLVVDTGIHAFGWSRDQAMNFLAENTALSLHEVKTETDRYISWPGQAVSYKIGELEIRALRQQAEAELGANFDVRQFHDTILKNGTVPLGVLRKEVERFIEQENAVNP